jgi:DNA-binding MarR family transcriptional regulator
VSQDRMKHLGVREPEVMGARLSVIAGPGGADFIIAREDNLEPSLQSCLKGLGISVPCELDVLAFVYRHGVTLASVNQIASLVGYETAAVDSALTRLERQELVERSQSSDGVCFFRFLAPADAGRKGCFKQLVSLLEDRVGRVLAKNQLKLGQLESCGVEHSYKTRNERE